MPNGSVVITVVMGPMFWIVKLVMQAGAGSCALTRRTRARNRNRYFMVTIRKETGLVVQ